MNGTFKCSRCERDIPETKRAFGSITKPLCRSCHPKDQGDKIRKERQRYQR